MLFSLSLRRWRPEQSVYTCFFELFLRNLTSHRDNGRQAGAKGLGSCSFAPSPNSKLKVVVQPCSGRHPKKTAPDRVAQLSNSPSNFQI